MVASVPLATAPEQAELQEEQYVHSVYNDIAPHFSLTRYKPWPIVEGFLKRQPDYSIGIDVGCGNGKYLGVNKKLLLLGTDRSSGLVECARGIDSLYNVGVADGLHLPHNPGLIDFAISIAVIHHFATRERRVAAIAHILSRLKKGGRLLVYCWALEQASSRRGYTEESAQDMLVPWVLRGKERDETRYRYYHLYRLGELDEDAATAGGRVVESGYEKDNWWAIVESN